MLKYFFCDLEPVWFHSYAPEFVPIFELSLLWLLGETKVTSDLVVGHFTDMNPIKRQLSTDKEWWVLVKTPMNTIRGPCRRYMTAVCWYDVKPTKPNHKLNVTKIGWTTISKFKLPVLSEVLWTEKHTHGRISESVTRAGQTNMDFSSSPSKC